MLISAGDIIKNSWQLYKTNWRVFAPYLMLLFVPTFILTLVPAVGISLFLYTPSSTLITSIITFAVLAASMVFALWVSIGFAKAVKGRLFNEEIPNVKTAFGATSHLLWPVIYTSILVALIVLGGMILFIIPGIIFTVWYAFTFYAVIFENQRRSAPLKTSKSLVAGRWWRILWRLVAPGFLFTIIGFVINYILMVPFEFLNQSKTITDMAYQIISSISNILVTPLTVAATIILYFSAKENPVGMEQPKKLEPPFANHPKQ